MNCQEINFLLDANSPEEFSIGQRHAIDQHFESCQACREAWTAYREVSALRIPKSPQGLRTRIVAEIAPNEARAMPRSLIIGGVLAVGAAVAAAVALRGADTSEVAQHLEEPALIALPDSQADSTHRVDLGASAETPNEASDSTSNSSEHALDPKTIVVVPALHPEPDPERTALFLRFHQEILQQLHAVPGLNVVPLEVVDPFVRSETPEEEIARNLGAANLVVLWTTSSDPSASLIVTPVDMTTGAATGKMGVSSPFEARWPAKLVSDATDVADFIKLGLTRLTSDQQQAAITEARAIVLNAALPVRARVTALGKLSRSEEVHSDAVVSAAVEIATTAPDWRAGIWRAMYGVDNPYLIQPLIDSLSYDAADHVRRQAAASLRTFITEPRVKAALEQAQASDPSEVVREAAQRALSSDEEVDQRALQKLLDETLPVRERLMATYIFEGGNGRAVSLTTEAARAVFEIGVTATDPDIRGSAWSMLGRNEVGDPGFTSVLLDDLASYPDDETRVMAAYALEPYVDDPVVRAALERAESDSSFEVRYAARRVLGMVPD